MKIGILGTRGIPNSYGGFEQFAEHLSQRLVGRGHEVFVYSSSLNLYQEKRWNGVNIVHCMDWEDKLGTAGQFIYDLNCIKDARKQHFDILLHLGYTSDSIWHRRWPHHTINLVNMDGLEWKRSKYSKPVQWFLKKAESWAATYADELIADSPAIKEYLLGAYRKKAVYIPYGADVFNHPDQAILKQFNLRAHGYYLTVSRLEPENNIEMIIDGHLRSGQEDPLVIVGGLSNKYGRKLLKKYNGGKNRFTGAIYDRNILSSLRYFSRIHFHGHSVGGTNPSLLEAMACSCRIAAHDNPFNRAVLQTEADYFSNEKQVSDILNTKMDEEEIDQRKYVNLERIESVYNWDKVVNEYELLMVKLLDQKGSCHSVGA